MFYIVPFPETGNLLYNVTQDSPGSGVQVKHKVYFILSKLTWTFEIMSISSDQTTQYLLHFSVTWFLITVYFY